MEFRIFTTVPVWVLVHPSPYHVCLLIFHHPFTTLKASNLIEPPPSRFLGEKGLVSKYFMNAFQYFRGSTNKIGSSLLCTITTNCAK